MSVESHGWNLGKFSSVSEVRKPEVPGQTRSTLQAWNDHWGHVGLEGSRAGVFGLADICPSALCQNTLGVHLDPCPRVAAPRGRVLVSRTTPGPCRLLRLSQMLLCTCALIRWHFSPVTKEFRNFAWFPCQKCVADIMGVGRSHGITKH